MTGKQQPEDLSGSQAQSSPAPKNENLAIGGDVGGNVVVGDHNYIVNNYYPVIENNTEKHEPDYWALKHPYPMPPHFTGRVAERAMLTYWLKEDSENRLFILRALGGFGKSALAWHWLTHDVDIKDYPRVLWWSFYEGDASFEHFIEETLKYLKLDVPQGQRPQVDELLKAMQGHEILLIMDGFERALRAYSSMNAAYQGDEFLTPPTPQPPSSPTGKEGGAPGGLPSPHGRGAGGEVSSDCVNINAEWFLKGVCARPDFKSKVLMTTRLTPHVVLNRHSKEFILGCREVELTSMQPADAVEFFHKQKIKGTHTEIEAACVPYGYHPLSLRLLAGRILKDFENPADIVVAQKLKIDGDIVQQKHHVLEVSYNSLPSHEHKLLSTIACFSSPVEYKTLQSIAESTDTLDSDLQDLRERGLLHFDVKNKNFDLHPIVRRYAYERLTAPDRIDAHTRLMDYFAAIPIPAKIGKLEDIASMIELYYHMVRAGKLDDAIVLFQRPIVQHVFYRFNSYQQVSELMAALFLDGEDKLPHLKGDAEQGWTLNTLSTTYALTGQPGRAALLLATSIKIYKKINDKTNLAIALGNMAHTIQLDIGELKKAKYNLHRRIKLCQEIKDKHFEATSHREIGRILFYCGKWNGAEQKLEIAEKLYDKETSRIQEYRALRFTFMARDKLIRDQPVKNYVISAIAAAQRALELVDERSKEYSVPRAYADVYWILGASYRANGELDKAEDYLIKAINLDRQINYVQLEANILLDLARLRYDQRNYEEAEKLGDEALTITERCGYVLQGADVNLFLAQYTLEQEKDKAKAKEYAETALKLAYCDGPPYYYKVAYHEAERLLENLK